MVREPRFGLVDVELEPVVEQELTRYRHGSVIDVGCGPVVEHLRNKASLVDKLIGVDNNSEVVLALQNQAIPHFEFRQADATALPFADSSVDLALLFGVYNDCRDDSIFDRIQRRDLREGELAEITRAKRDLLLPEISRIISPTGTVLVANSSKRSPLAKVKPVFERYFGEIDVHQGPQRYLMVCRYKK